MKRVIGIFLLICFVFLAVACEQTAVVQKGNGDQTQNETNQPQDETEQPQDETEQPSYDGEPLRLSAQMFDNARIDLHGIEKIGLVEEDAYISDVAKRLNWKKTYIVSFQKDGTYEKIPFIFKKTDQNGETYEVTQEQIEGYPANLYVTSSFIFLQYRQYPKYSELLERFPKDEKFFQIGYKNFVIDRATGKIFSLNDMVESFDILSNNLLASGNEWSNGSKMYYYLRVENGTFTVTNLMPNQNIRVYNAIEDAFGNIYIYNDSISRKDGNLIYVTERILAGDDGYVYVFDKTVYAKPGEESSGRNLYTVKRYGRDGILQENWGEVETVVRFYTEENLEKGGYVSLFGNEIYVANADGNTRSEGCWCGTLTEGAANTYRADFHLFDMAQTFPLTPHIMVAQLFGGQIWYYDLSSKKILSHEGYLESFENQGMVLQRASLFLEGTMILARVEDVSGTTVYKIGIKTGANGLPTVTATLYEEVQQPENILISRPLS